MLVVAHQIVASCLTEITGEVTPWRSPRVKVDDMLPSAGKYKISSCY